MDEYEEIKRDFEKCRKRMMVLADKMANFDKIESTCDYVNMEHEFDVVMAEFKRLREESENWAEVYDFLTNGPGYAKADVDG